MNRQSKLARLWQYRNYISGSVFREIQSKYKNSLLGVSWLLIHPLTMIGVYTIIFSNIMRSKIPGVESTGSYSIFLLAGLIHWGLFSEIWAKGSDLFRSNANILKKVEIPFLCLPLVLLISSLLNYLIVLIVMLLVTSLFGMLPGIQIFGLALPLLILCMLSISCAVIFAVLNVYFKDVSQVAGVLLQLLFWFTPIVYSLEVIPEAVRPLINLNPLAPLFKEFQLIFVNKNWPDLNNLVYPAIVAIVLLIIAAKTLKSQELDLVDDL